jgi:GNAT superfamily N-acetyltransferase
MREEITVRHSEPEDYEAVYRVYSGPLAMADTLGLPFSPKDPWRGRLKEERDGEVSLVACVGTEVVGHLSLYPYPEPRRRHSGHFGMAVRDDWRRQGVGTKLMEAALDLADNWLGSRAWTCASSQPTKRPWGSTGNSASRWRACTGGSPCEQASTPTPSSWLASSALDFRELRNYELLRIPKRRSSQNYYSTHSGE